MMENLATKGLNPRVFFFIRPLRIFLLLKVIRKLRFPCETERQSPMVVLKRRANSGVMATILNSVHTFTINLSPSLSTSSRYELDSRITCAQAIPQTVLYSCRKQNASLKNL